jgi:hypothetical protein
MATQTFTVNSESEKLLETLGVKKIKIKRISSNSDIHSLFCPIEIKIAKPSGEIRTLPLNASTYFSNTKPGIATDIEMNYIITSCQNTVIRIINNLNLEPFILTFEYEELVDLIDVLIIYVNNQSEGRTYSLHPLSKQQLKIKFPASHPAGQLYTSYEDEHLFQIQHGDIIKPFVQGITNLSNDELLRIGRFEFVDPRTNNVLHITSFDQ